MSDAGPFDAVVVNPPAPWGPRPMGQGVGLQTAPVDPHNEEMSNRDQITARVDRLESDHRALLIAFGAAFVVLLAIFGGGFMTIASKVDSGFAASAQRDEAITAAVAEVRTDVAVVKERVPARPASER